MTYTPAGPPQPAKKNKTGLIVGIIIGVVLLLCLGCGGALAYVTWWAKDTAEDIVNNLPTDFPTEFPADPDGNIGSHIVRYEISGEGEAFITWARGVGGQDSETAQLPWSKEITVDRANFGVMVFAVPADGKDASITGCRLLIDSQEKDRKDAKNNFATCAETFVGNP